MLKTNLTVLASIFVLSINQTMAFDVQTSITEPNQSETKENGDLLSKDSDGVVDEVKTIVGKFEITLDEWPDDKVKPTSIQHNVDEIIVDGRLMERYNFFVYSFEQEGEVYSARTYLSTIQEVSLFGPFENIEKPQVKVERTEYYDDVMAYLKRRFRHIQALGEEGYETTWKDPNFVGYD